MTKISICTYQASKSIYKQHNFKIIQCIKEYLLIRKSEVLGNYHRELIAWRNDR